jgi:eukaryotic-like serine/threonine-protein kinase
VTLASGVRLGRYEIVAPLGAGGMGEVYRATDATLRRDVALKILPEALVSDASRLARFEQEARATAALHHPNIVTIHDFGTAGATPYLVTELLEGQTLADVLVRGAVPLRRALGWAVQILRGIAAAHARGIIHRDLKPGNIFILGDGSVKILDFGLARIADDPVPRADAPTVRLSEAGMVLGTAGYMSPEQLRGVGVDARSDIFSFAVVLHEMLTGRAPFQRDSGAETLAAILNDDPPRLESPPFPAVLATTIQRCLDKSPAERFHSAHDLALHLDSIELAPSGPMLAMSDAPAHPDSQQITFRRGNVYNARFAPDGSIVYGAAWNDQPLELYIAHRGLPESRGLGISASIHAVSRNGELAVSLNRRNEFGFQASGTLARLGLSGGVPRPIATGVQEADWSPDGRQLAIARRSESGYRIEYPIGRTIYETPSWISDMRLSPSGQELAFIEHPFAGDNFGHVSVIDLNGRAQQLTSDLYICWGLAWHPRGEIWFSAALSQIDEARNISLFAVSRGAEMREVYSTLGAVILRDIAPDGAVLISQDGFRRQMIAHLDGEPNERDLSWLDWSLPMRLSADGRTLLFEEQGIASRGKWAFYIRPTDGGPAVRLDEGRGRDLSADGEHVLAVTTGRPERLLLVPTGAGAMREIPVRGVDLFQTARFVPGEREIVVVGSRGDEAARAFRVPADGGEAVPISGPIASWFSLTISPDGNRIAAIGMDQMPFLASLSGDGEPQPVRGAELGEFPVHWRGDGALLVCRREEQQTHITAIDLATGARTHVRTLRPHDVAGVQGVFPIQYAASDKSYVFGYRLVLSSLFVVKGLR